MPKPSKQERKRRQNDEVELMRLDIDAEVRQRHAANNSGSSASGVNQAAPNAANAAAGRKESRSRRESEAAARKRSVVGSVASQGPKTGQSWWAGVFGGKAVSDVPLQSHALTWEMVTTTGLAPPPRHGHSMTAIGSSLFVFGGVVGGAEVNDLYILHTDSMSWEQPLCQGTLPHPRQRHCAVALPNKSLFVWGGIGGGNEVFFLDTHSMTWFQARVKGHKDDPDQAGAGELPAPKWGCSAVLMEQSVVVIGGHDGRRGVDEVWELDLTVMTWRRVQHFGQTPSLGARHTGCGVSQSRALVFGATELSKMVEIHSVDVADGTSKWNVHATQGTAPPNRTRHTSTVLNNAVVVFGGVNNGRPNNDLYMLHLDTFLWQEPAAAGTPPVSRMDHAAATCMTPGGTKLFVYGGHNGVESLSDVCVLMVMQWQEVEGRLGSPPPPRIGHTATVVGNMMYLIGGATNGVQYNDIRTYSFETEVWNIPKVDGMPPPALVAHTTVLAGSDLLVLGGGTGKDAANGLVLFDIPRSRWESDQAQRGPLHPSRYGHAACIVRHRMFVFGGFSVETEYTNKLSVLNTQTLEWSEPATGGSPPVPRACHSMDAVGNVLVLLGGANEEEILGDLHILETVTMQWQQPRVHGSLSDIPAPLYNHRTCAIGSKLFVFGGLLTSESAGGRAGMKAHPGWRRHRTHVVTDTLFVLDRTTMKWDKPNIAGMPPPARFRCSACAWGSRVVVFGGHGGGSSLWFLDTGTVPDAMVTLGRIKNEEHQKRPTTGKDSGVPVVRWIGTLGLEKYSRVFVKAELDWDSLLDVSEDDLVDMGVTALGPRKRIMHGIEKERRLRELVESQGARQDLYLGRYRMDRLVDFGQLPAKLATDTKTGKQVALKFSSDLSVIRSEVAMLRELRSDYIVELIDWHEDPDGKAHCVVLEHASFSLQSLFRSKGLTINERKFAIHRLALAMRHLHSRGIVLCDLKPSNVYLFGTQWKLVELSTARHVGEVVPQHSPLHAAPEWAETILAQRLFGTHAHPALDSWLLGCLVVESFVYRGFLRTTTPETLQLVASPGSVLLPSLKDEQARHLVTALLAKDVSERLDMDAVLRHGYLVGGMDSEQMKEAFGFLRQQQHDMNDRFNALSDFIHQKRDEAERVVRESQKKANQQREAQQGHQ